MNNQFDELAKGLAQSVTRRGAFKKFGVGLAGLALALLGMASKASARPGFIHCNCKKPFYGCRSKYDYPCYTECASLCGP